MTRPRRPPAAPRWLRSLLMVAATSIAAVTALGIERGGLAALVLGPGVVLVVRILERHTSAPPADRSLALALDLTAAALRGGRPLAEALALAAPAADPEAAAGLVRVAGLLRLGAEPAQAWRGALDGPLAAIAVPAIRSAASGIRLAGAFERSARDIRAECARVAATRAARAGTAALAPLAACFLPSFVCLGIVPVVIGIARSALGVL